MCASRSNEGFAVRQTNVFYLSVHNMFRPRLSIIGLFLRKYMNDDGVHMHYSVSILVKFIFLLVSTDLIRQY